MVVAIFPLLFVSDNEAVLYKITTTAESLFSHMTDGAGCTTITEGHSPACCSACAPVLGFRQPVAAPTHVATGAASEGRNSINKTRPLDNIHRVRAAAPRERVNHLFRPSPPPSSPSHPPPPIPVTCQPLPLMSDILGYHSYRLNQLLGLYVMKL